MGEWRKKWYRWCLLSVSGVRVSFLPAFQGQENKGISPEGKHSTLEDLGHKLFANCAHCHHDITL